MLSADCGPAPNDGWGANYPSYAAWCQQCGGRPYNNNGVGCDMSGASSGSSYRAPAVGGVNGAILQGIQNGIQQGQRNAAEQKQRLQMENDRSLQQMIQDNAVIQEDAREKANLIEEKNRIAATKEKQTEAQRTDEILSQMRGGFGASSMIPPIQEMQGVSLQPKDLSKMANSEISCVREMDFNEYQKRESERKDVLGRLSGYSPYNKIMKATADWCKIHIPLPPSPSSADYCRQKPVYEARINDWRMKCALVMEVPTSSSQTSVNPGKGSQNMPVPDCLGVYDGEAKSCDSENLILFNNCINKALHSFIQCMNFDDPDKGTFVHEPAIPIRSTH
jgi:hypothetical protein